MKNILLFQIIFVFIFSACSDFTGNEDAVEASLKPGPVAKQKKEAEEEEEATRTWYNLYGVTFGDNTFVAVGKTGAIRTSSDNGSSWDNGTSGTTYYFNEVEYGDSIFIAVGQNGRIYTSSDNGTTWSRSTWNGSSAHLTGVAYGNNISIAVSSSNVIKSTDYGSNWTLKSSAVEVYDMAYGNRAASGKVATCGTITHGGDHDNDNYTSVALSGGSGSGAQATVIVSGDNVTSVSITEGGTSLYQIGDVLTIDNATIGGNDNGEVATCDTITHGGGVATVGTITHGGDHDNDNYTSVALSGGSGSGAEATVIVSGDNVTSVSITNGGNGLYQIGDVLTIDNATIGGDDNATCRVETVSGDLVNDTYDSVALSGGSGSGAQATVIVSGDNVTSVSITPGGTGLYQIGDVLTIDNSTIGLGGNTTCRVAAVTAINATCRVATVTVTSTAFIGVGADGSICYSSDASDHSHGEAWLCPAPIVSDKKLYGIAYGNNKFIAVGESGTVIRSDNGSVWGFRTSNSSGNLYSIAFGNDRFVAVGYNTVIVSTDNGTVFTQTATSYDFNDISFGNGIFVAVGDDENIHTSTDGNDWTKVYGK
jgi:hypothetical protein